MTKYQIEVLNTMRGRGKSAMDIALALPSHGNSPCLPALSPVPSAANTIAAKPPPRDRSGSVPPTILTGKPTAPPKPSRKKS